MPDDLQTIKHNKLFFRIPTWSLAGGLRTHEVVTEDRTHEVITEDRTHEVVIEDRTHEVVTEDRTHEVVTEDRTHEVVTEDRTHEVVTEDRGPRRVNHSRCWWIAGEERPREVNTKYQKCQALGPMQASSLWVNTSSFSFQQHGCCFFKHTCL